MLTSFADDEAVYVVIMAGASGYVLKQVRGSDLVDGIRRVPAGESLLDPAVTTRVLERLRARDEPDELAGLTDQERAILEHIAEGLTNRQIGELMFLAEKTVKNYVSNIFSKLGMSRRTEAALYAVRLWNVICEKAAATSQVRDLGPFGSSPLDPARGRRGSAGSRHDQDARCAAHPRVGPDRPAGCGGRHVGQRGDLPDRAEW